MNEVIKKWYEEHEQSVRDWALDIWRNPEISMEEYHACEVTAAIMKQHGFSVEVFNCKDPSLPPNTVVATWGSGKPVIGFVGEYDGLPGMGQESVPYRASKEGPGHGCGHSLMTPSCGSAAIALKAAMEAEGLQGTIKFFACPAEESGEGKMYMAHKGVFEGVDCCMAWHPESVNLQIREQLQTTNCSLKVEFFGTAAHASAYPERGRSALDACELMNVGMNYMREHMETTSRVHYSYLAAGEKPNIVPDYAALHYFVRAKDVKSNFALLERMKKCAQGASLMTETDYKITVIAHTPGCIQVNGFNRFFYEAAAKIPPLTYDEDEMAFAKELFKNVNGRDPEPGESPAFTDILAPTGTPEYSAGSTDSGHISHCVPTSRLRGWGLVKGSPSHSWGYVAAAGHSIGLKGALYAGMAQAQCGYEIMKDPAVIAPWRADWEAQLAAEGSLKPLLPGELK